MSDLLKDSNGQASSKRVAGYIAGGVAIVLSVVALMWAENADIAVDLVKAFLTFSAGLLGIGVAERFGKK